MERHNPRVPVLNPDSTPAMPTTASRARRWFRDDKAKVATNKLGIFTVQLLHEPKGYQKQDIVIGLDPGKLYSGLAVQSPKATLFTAHLELTEAQQPLTSIGRDLDNVGYQKQL